MISDDEIGSRLAELSARIDSLEGALEALRATPPASEPRPGVVAPAVPPLPPPGERIPQGLPGPVFQSPLPKSAVPARSLESRIGSQLLNRIGIIALLIGTAWFLKLAFDRDWIGPGVRILIGLASAGGVLVWSERFRRQGFVVFSNTLKALATGIAYLSLWAAFNVYHLVPHWVAFLAMVAVTITNAFLAWRQDSELLAFYALTGGLITPALLSVGEGHEIFLFSYLLLRNAGALVLLAARPWKRLVVMAFAGTVAYYGAWNARYYDASDFAVTLLFVALLFAAFACAPFLLGRKIRVPASDFDLLFLIAFPIINASVTFLELMALLEEPVHHPWRAWAAFALAMVFLLLSTRLRGRTPSALTNVHLGLFIFFLTAGLKLEFHGYVLLLCWLAESLILIALAAARSHAAMRLCGAAVLALAVLGVLLLEWSGSLQFPLPVLANMHFATYLIAAGVLLAVIRLSLGAQGGFSLGGWSYLAGFSTIAFSLIVLLAVSLEIHHYWFCGATFFRDFCDSFTADRHRAAYASFSYSAWYMLYGAALMTAGFLRRSSFLRWQALFLLAFSIGKVFLFDAGHLSQGYRVLSFLGLGALLLAVSFAYQKDWLALRGGRAS